MPFYRKFDTLSRYCGIELNPIAYGILSFSSAMGVGGGLFGPHPRKHS